MDSRRTIKQPDDNHSFDDLEFQKRAQMYQLGQIVKTLDEYKSIKERVAANEKTIKDIDHWRHQQSMAYTKDLVVKSELSLMMEMMKSDIQVAMRAHFEIFKNETDSGINKKVEAKELKSALAAKVSTSEFFREMESVKSQIYSISRDLAMAGIGGSSSSGGGNKAANNSAIKTLIRQEIERKADQDKVDEAIKLKADLAELKEVIARQNTLESYVYKMFDKKPKQERDITQQMLDRDDEEDDRRGHDRMDDDQTNLDDMEESPYKSKKVAKQQLQHSLFPNNTVTQGSFVQQSQEQQKKSDTYLNTQTNLGVAGNSSLYPDNNPNNIFKSDAKLDNSREKYYNNGNVQRSGQMNIKDGRTSQDIRHSPRKDSDVHLNKMQLPSDFNSPRGSPLQASLVAKGDDMKNRPDNYYLIDKQRVDMIAVKKKLETLQTIFNKQTDYFDDHMYKMGVQLENIGNLEKRMSLSSQSIELIPQLQQNLLDIRDNQLPNLVEDLRRQMVSKIESALSKNTTATVKADSVEQKVHLLAEHVKKQIPIQEKEKHHQDNQAWIQDGRYKILEQRIKDVEGAMLERITEFKKEFDPLKQPLMDQITRANRENESLHRELDRQQDQTRKILSQFQKTLSTVHAGNTNASQSTFSERKSVRMKAQSTLGSQDNIFSKQNQARASSSINNYENSVHNQLQSLDVSMAANYLENHHHHNYSINNSPSAKSNLGITQSSMRAAAGLMQTALPRINGNQFEKQSSPLTLVKPVSQFMSPRSITQFSNLAKFVESNKKMMDDINNQEFIPRMRESSNKKKDKVIGNKMPVASSSIGFQLNGQTMPGSQPKKTGFIDQSKLDSITNAYLSAGNVGLQIGSNGLASGPIGTKSMAGQSITSKENPLKSPFKLLKEAEQSEANLDYQGNNALQTMYAYK